MIDPAVILARAAAIWHTTIADLVGPRRFVRLTAPRQAVAYALRQHGYGVQEIGEILHRDHTTICYSLKQAAERAASDPRYAAQLRALLGEAAPAPPPATVRATVAVRRSLGTPITPGLRLALTFWGVSQPQAA